MGFGANIKPCTTPIFIVYGHIADYTVYVVVLLDACTVIITSSIVKLSPESIPTAAVRDVKKR